MKIEVGKPLHPGRTRWPEGAQYNYDAGGHSLVLFFADPTPSEIKAVKSGRWQFAMHVQDTILFLCYRALQTVGKGLPWSDANYSWHLLPIEDRPEPPMLGNDQRATLKIILIDASTGLVKALRLLSWSPEFSQAIHQAIHDQIAAEYEPGTHDQALANAYSRFPQTSDMAKSAAITTWGGA